MRCGLFGKLSAKRDFIALFAPRRFLDAWEPWMQGSIAASRDRLGSAWQGAFLSAPIWRFWLGPEICGATVAGVFMPSLDGVGRYYPLTLFAYADPGIAIAPPDIDAQNDWYHAAEEYLLSTLEKETPFEHTASALDELPPPASVAAHAPQGDMVAVADGTLAAHASNSTLPDLFVALRAANFASVYSAASFWWTIGGEDFEPLALCCRRMPDPFLFASMLTGQLEPAVT
jgi:type VI secretion system protein ImpM